MPPTIHQVVTDPDFAKLSVEDQHAVLNHFAPDLGSTLTTDDVPDVVSGLQKFALSRPDLAPPSGYTTSPGAQPAKPEGLVAPSGKTTATPGKAIVPAMGGGFIAMDVPQGEEAKFQQAYMTGQRRGEVAGLSALGAGAVAASPFAAGLATGIKGALAGAGGAGALIKGAGIGAGQAVGRMGYEYAKDLYHELTGTKK